MKLEAFGRAEALFQGEEVGDGLAGVLEVGERVDDGDARAGGHLGDGVVRVGAEDDDVHPALEVVGHVGEGLALAEGRLGLVDEDGVAAEGVDGGLEGEAGAQRGLLEEHDHLARVERVAEVFGMVLDGVGELHDGGHLLHGEVGDGAEVAAGETLGGLGEGGVGLDAEGLRGERRACRRVRDRARRSGRSFSGDADGLATHAWCLLPDRTGVGVVLALFACVWWTSIGRARRRLMSTCSLLQDEGRKEAQHGVAGAVEDDAALHHLVRRSWWRARRSRARGRA